jgi:hypothetical protein
VALAFMPVFRRSFRADEDAVPASRGSNGGRLAASSAVTKVPLKDASTGLDVGEQVCSMSLGGSQDGVWVRADDHVFHIQH